MTGLSFTLKRWGSSLFVQLLLRIYRSSSHNAHNVLYSTMSAQLKLLGLPRFITASGGLGLPHGKTSALLLYLAYQNDWVGRDTLLYLLWPDAAESPARKNLRQLLSSAKHLPYASGLEVEHDRLRWLVTSDVQGFKRAVQDGRWSRAAQLYGGPLLHDFTLPNAPDFDDWLEGERRELYTAWRGAVLAFADELEAAGRFVQAADLLMGLRKADPLDEASLRRLLCSLHHAGQPGRALEVYGAFEEFLQDELGGKPEEETRGLVHALQGSTPAEPAPAASQERRSPTSPRHNLRAPLTPLIGREAEKAKLLELLAGPGCRLVTLTGPGGVGKSRLALAVAWEAVETFEHGVWCVSLASAGSPELLIPTIAEALGLPFYGEGTPRAQLLDFLRGRELLLILDNVEHLLAGTALVAEMLEAAPDLKVLATSRERLHLPGEWVVGVGGLTFPSSLGDADPQTHTAVELFRQSARRVGSEVTEHEGDLRLVSRITQLVEGLPLALELCAAWLRVLPLAEIAEGLAQGLELLEATDHVEGRHKSVHAAFEHSWRLLSGEERRVLGKLSVFRGSFTKDAASAVAGATLPLLSALVDKSLLRRQHGGHFDLHELVKQYAATKLAEAAVVVQEAHDHHCRYYTAFLHEREHWVVGGGERQAASLGEIDEVLGDVRAAWRWATTIKNVSALEDALETLLFFLDTRALFEEGEETFRAAACALGEEGTTFAKLLIRRGWFNFRLGRPDACQDACEKGLAVLERLGSPPDGVALHTLGVLYAAQGKLEQAQAVHERALALARAQGNQIQLAGVLNTLGVLCTQRGKIAEAERYYRESITHFRGADDRVKLSASLINLGKTLLVRERFTEAEEAFGESLGLAAEGGNTFAMATLFGFLGTLSRNRGEFEKAEAYHLQALKFVQENLPERPPQPSWNDEPHLVRSLIDLGDVNLCLERYETAFTYFRRALEVALEHKEVPAARVYALESTVGMASALTRLGRDEQALALLTFSLEQPELDAETRRKAEQLYAEIGARDTAGVIKIARHRGCTLKFETVLYHVADWY